MSDTKYLVAARKYRPQLFGDVVAQEHVTETLKNAIKMDRLAHAYLFSGPRGVGKTTIARILAKAINCEVPLEDRPEAEPCEKCTSCTSFNEGRSLNVIEIDAASNNKVDDVRELRDTVRIPPQGARKKVYIVDEVHMLSNAAFNAFLKTLEEPPPYALFIFATTEPRKVIPTILSRCQRFDFKRIPVAEIISRLSEIADQESISVDEASLMLIAQKGDGALRDALSVFDQAVSLCGTSITYAELAQALRVVDQELFFAATTNIADGNSSGMLDLIDKITSEGYDLQEFLAGLAGHIRNLLVAVSTGQTTLIEATEAMQAQYMDHSKTFSEQQLLRLLVILSQTEESVGRSTQPRLAAELGLLKMASSMNAVDLRKALARVEQLEKKVKSANTLAQATPRSSGDSVSEAIKAAPDREKAPEPIEIKPISRKIKEHKQAPPASDEPAVEQVASEPAQKAGTKQSPSEQKKTEPKVSTPDPAEETSAPVVPSGPGLFGPPALQKKPRGSHADATKAGVIEGSLAIATSPAQRVPDSIESLWLKYVSTIKSIRIHVGSLLQHAAPVDVRQKSVIVAVPDDFHRRLLDNQHDFLLKHLNSASETKYRKIEFVVREIAPVEGTETKSNDFDPYEYMKRKRQESPIVKAIFEDFGGELVW